MARKNTMGANIPNATRQMVYQRDGYRCALCDDRRGLQIHHVVKRSQGGTNLEHNLITLCWKCHAVAHGTAMPEYPDYMTAKELNHACVEYLSDLYADEGILWNPWSRERYELQGCNESMEHFKKGVDMIGKTMDLLLKD